MKQYNCISCNNPIKQLDPDVSDMWDGGIVDEIQAGFGSIFDGRKFIIAICDECLKEKKLLSDKDEIVKLEKQLDKLKRHNRDSWEIYGSELCAGDMFKKEEELQEKINKLKNNG